MSIRRYFNKACKELGLEHRATLAIGHILDKYRKGTYTFTEALSRARYEYNKAIGEDA